MSNPLVKSFAASLAANGWTGDDALTSEIFNCGPMNCGIDASKILDYTSDIASGYSLNTDHVISADDWDNDVTEGGYWTGRDSWREFWGEQEYIRVKAGWFINLGLGQQCAWAVPDDFSAPERDDTIHCWGLDRIESVDISFNDEYEWEPDFPDGGAGANVYAFDTGTNVNNGDFGGWATNRYICLSLCAEVGSCTDNDAQGHGIHVAGTAAGHQYVVAKHAIIHGMQVIGSDGGGTIIGALNAMDEVVSSVERQMSIASSAGTVWDTVVNTATNDYDAIGPLPWPTGLPAPGCVPKTNPLNGRWVTVTGGDTEFRSRSLVACLVAPRRRRFKLATTKVMGAVTVLEELPRRSMSVRTIWTTASLTSAILDRASTPVRPGGNTTTGFLHPPTKW